MKNLLRVMAIALTATGTASAQSSVPRANPTSYAAPDVVLGGRAGAGSALSTGTSATMTAPALLGWGGGFQIQIPGAVTAEIQSGPVRLNSVRDAGGRWTVSEREGWLQTLNGNPFTAGATATVGTLALRLGSIGLSVDHTVLSTLAIPADAVEAALFGNAGRTGVPRDLDLTGGNASGAAWTTVRLGHGRRIGTWRGAEVLVGGTGEARLLHALVSLPETDGAITADPLGANARFRGILARPRGGIEVGVQWRFSPSVALVGERWRATATWEGAVATTPNLHGRVEQGDLDVILDENVRTAQTESRPGTAEDRDSLQSLVGSGRRWRGGLAYRAHSRIWLVTDFVAGARELGMAKKSDAQYSAGAELRLIGPLQARGGAVSVGGETGYRTGVGLGLGPVTIDVAYGRTPGLGAEQLAASVRLGSGQGALWREDR